MALKDLREYIARLEEEGEIQRIDKEVDWNLEIGAVIRRSYDLRAPAPFFQKIKGSPPGYRLLGAPLGLSDKPSLKHCRLAISLGMKPEASLPEIMEEYIRRRKHPIKPILVSTGPCKENILLGDKVDLEKFPVPLLHLGDGGRYIGTWHAVITKDPDTGWVNWGMYRMMMHDKKSSALRISPSQDIGLIYYDKYEGRGRPMQVAIAIGTDPVTPLIAATAYPPGIDEADMVGAVRGEPIELVKCETVDLAVPAYSEIVLEGEVRPGDLKDEGPFGEYTGYQSGARMPRPVLRVKAVTHRNNPILTTSCPGMPVDESAARRPIDCAELLDHLRTEGFPVKMVNLPMESTPQMVVVSTRVPFANYAKHLASAVWGTSAGGGMRANYLVIVEDDVDAFNINEIMWALTTRCHPDRGIFQMPRTWGAPWLPFTSREEKSHNMAAHVLFDCTWPKEWPKEAVPVKASFDVLWPKDIQEKVLKSWKEYGYKE